MELFEFVPQRGVSASAAAAGLTSDVIGHAGEWPARTVGRGGREEPPGGLRVDVREMGVRAAGHMPVVGRRAQCQGLRKVEGPWKVALTSFASMVGNCPSSPQTPIIIITIIMPDSKSCTRLGFT